MTYAEKAAARIRIAAIDALFDSATGWGSWMVSAANEREALVARLQAAGEAIEHEHLARNMWGGRID